MIVVRTYAEPERTPCSHGVVDTVCWTCYVVKYQLPHLSYHDWVEETAAVMGSDGCTFAGPWYRWGCLEHDIGARAGVRRDGTPISDAENDVRFRSYIQRTSKFGWFSPVAWWRWLAVKLFVTAPRPALLMADPVAWDAARRREEILAEELL